MRKKLTDELEDLQQYSEKRTKLEKKFSKNLRKEHLDREKEYKRTAKEEKNLLLKEYKEFEKAYKHREAFEKKITKANKKYEEMARKTGGTKRAPQVTGKGLAGAGAAVGGSLLNTGFSIAGSAAFAGLGYLYQGYDNLVKYHRSLINNAGSGSSKDIRAAVNNRGGSKYGYNLSDSSENLFYTNRATGDLGTLKNFEATTRATGMTVQEVAGTYESARNAGGFDLKDKTSQNIFSKLTKGAVASGFKDGLKAEFIKGTFALSDQVGMSTSGNIATDKIAAILGSFAGTGLPGGRGKRGINLGMQVDQAIKNPTSDWARMANLQAFGFGVPGSTTSYLGAKRQMQRGIAGSDYTALEKIVRHAERQYADKDSIAEDISERLGLNSMDNADLIRQAVNSGDKKRIEEAMKKAEPIEKQADEAMVGLATAFKKFQKKFDDSTTVAEKHQKDIEELDRQIQIALKNLADTMSTLLPEVTRMLKVVNTTVSELHDWLVGKFPGLKTKQEIKQDKKEVSDLSTLRKEIYGNKPVSAGKLNEYIVEKAKYEQKVKTEDKKSGWFDTNWENLLPGMPAVEGVKNLAGILGDDEVMKANKRAEALTAFAGKKLSPEVAKTFADHPQWLLIKDLIQTLKTNDKKVVEFGPETRSIIEKLNQNSGRQ